MSSFIINIGKVTGSYKIAAFDLDWTLIKPKSGNKFPKDKDDWILMNDSIKEKLNKFINENFKIVIFTNQGSSKFNKEEFNKKIENIAEKLELKSLQVFVATDNTADRKPAIGLWNILKNNNSFEIDLTQSFYVGDAIGRASDFSDSDLKFARNIGIKMYDPEFNEVTSIPIHPLTMTTHPLTMTTHPLTMAINNETQEMIILVGPPGSGKSNVAKSISEGSGKYVIVCQDTLGTKVKVIKLIKQSLANGNSVIIDRKNEYKKDAKKDKALLYCWSEIAKTKEFLMEQIEGILKIEMNRKK